MSDQWHLLHDGQQYGPYSGEDLLQFVQEGRIVRDSLLWTEGMDEWVPATSIEGLFPPAPSAAAPQSGPPRPVAAGSPGAKMASRTGTAGRATGQASSGTRQAARSVPAGPYPAVAIKPANFELLLTLLGSWVVLLLLATWATWTMGKSEPPIPGIPTDMSAKGNQQIMLTVILVAAAACQISWWALNLVYLGRLWKALQHGRARTTPGKAVGLLFVPFFNLYWIFVAIYGLAQDWNRITSRYTDLSRGPKLNEGMFLAYCCCSILFPPGALVLWFPVMLQVCRAICFIALPPVHRARMSR